MLISEANWKTSTQGIWTLLRQYVLPLKTNKELHHVESNTLLFNILLTKTLILLFQLNLISLLRVFNNFLNSKLQSSFKLLRDLIKDVYIKLNKVLLTHHSIRV